MWATEGVVVKNRCAESKALFASSNWFLDKNLSPKDRHTDNERRSSYKRCWLLWWLDIGIDDGDNCDNCDDDDSAIETSAETWFDMVDVVSVMRKIN